MPVISSEGLEFVTPNQRSESYLPMLLNLNLDLFKGYRDDHCYKKQGVHVLLLTSKIFLKQVKHSNLGVNSGRLTALQGW